jgi:hypothetical protein
MSATISDIAQSRGLQANAANAHATALLGPDRQGVPW